MADDRSHYEVLRVRRDATTEELRAAYLRLARRFHPDVVGSDLADISEAEREMRAINAAWDVLGDDTARRRYDRTLPTPRPTFVGDDGSAAAHDAPFAGFGDTPMPPDADGSGAPVVGIARFVVRLAPLCFVAGFGILTLGAVLQMSAVWSSGLAILLISLVAFLLAPFLVMSSGARARAGATRAARARAAEEASEDGHDADGSDEDVELDGDDADDR